MIVGWLRDHRVLALAGALLAALGLRVKDIVLGNPLGESLVSLDASAFAVFVTVGAAVVALPSRVAMVLLVRSPWRVRLAWLATLTSTAGLVVALSAPMPSSVLLLGCRVAIVVCFPLSLCAAMGEGAGLIATFVLFAAHLMSPRDGPAPWWSPLRNLEVGPPRLVVAITAASALVWLYVGHGEGRRAL